MSGAGLTVRDGQGRRIGSFTLANALTWLAIIAPMLAIVERILASAPGTPWWPALVIVLLALISADLPDSYAPLLTITTAAAWWIVVVDDARLGSGLVIALGVLLFHSATSHAATGPPGRDDDPTVLRRVVVRTGLVGAATVMLWGIAAAAAGQLDFSAVLVGVALLGAGTLPWLGNRWPESAEESPGSR